MIVTMMTIIVILILLLDIQHVGVTARQFDTFKRASSPPMSIEEAAKTSTVAGSNDTEAEDTAETEVKSFEMAEAAAETEEMRNQPYNAADWMQPAAAWWLLAPSSKLAR